MSSAFRRSSSCCSRIFFSSSLRSRAPYDEERFSCRLSKEGPRIAETYRDRVRPVFRCLSRAFGQFILASNFLFDSVLITLATIQVVVDAVQITAGNDAHSIEVCCIGQSTLLRHTQPIDGRIISYANNASEGKESSTSRGDLADRKHCVFAFVLAGEQRQLASCSDRGGF